MRRKTVQNESKSLKTFYLYSVFVAAIIIIALLIKLLFVIQASKFDGRHHFTVAVTKEQKVKEIIAFSPQVPSVAVLRVQDDNVTFTSLGRNYGIAADVQLEVNNAVPLNQDVTSTMWSSVQHYTSVQTDATIIDLIRLALLSRDIISNNKVIREISLQTNKPENSTLIARALNDPTISSESVSIQVINASNISGAGQRLSSILTNMGANVVEVSTSHTPQAKSQIQYFGERSYTNEQVEQYLEFPVSELSRQPIADIVIILGEDIRNTRKF
jgi:hypothetical protein